MGPEVTFDARAYWTRRHAETPGLRATGLLSASEDAVRLDYDAKAAILAELLAELAPRSVLDLGFGRGFAADCCARAGVPRYFGIDIAADAPTAPYLRTWPLGYRFMRGDAAVVMGDGADHLPAGCDYAPDLCLVLDVAYHIIDDDAFAGLLDVAARARDVVVTDRFREQPNPPPHMRTRPMRAYEECLGEPSRVVPWSDLSLAVWIAPRAVPR